MPKNSLFGDLVSDGEVNATASAGYARQVLSVHLAEMMQRQGLTKRQMVEKLNINDEAQLDALLDPQSENLLFETFGRAVSNIGYTVKISLVGAARIRRRSRTACRRRNTRGSG
jgi:uncharacterized lipoprotein YmbA